MKIYNLGYIKTRVSQLGFESLQDYLESAIRSKSRKAIERDLNVSSPTLIKWLRFYKLIRIKQGEPNEHIE